MIFLELSITLHCTYVTQEINEEKKTCWDMYFFLIAQMEGIAENTWEVGRSDIQFDEFNVRHAVHVKYKKSPYLFPPMFMTHT